MEIKRGSEEDNNKSQIEVTIKDTGVGISQDILPRLFSKFATCSPSGTGLGLYISMNIVEAHRGKMWEARLQRSFFSLYLTPCNQQSKGTK